MARSVDYVAGGMDENTQDVKFFDAVIAVGSRVRGRPSLEGSGERPGLTLFGYKPVSIAYVNEAEVCWYKLPNAVGFNRKFVPIDGDWV